MNEILQAGLFNQNNKIIELHGIQNAVSVIVTTFEVSSE